MRPRHTYQTWTDEQIFWFIVVYPHAPTEHVARMLGRTVPSCYQLAGRLGLKKTAEYLATFRPGWLDGVRGGSTRFQKGHVPANKGLRRPGWARGRMAETQFKKGRPASEAHNYRPIGSLRVSKDGYLERKVTDDPAIFPARRWVAVHRLVWEAAHGPIPPRHVICFLPGRHIAVEAEITPDRLQMVSQKDLMRRNSRHNLPPEISQCIQLRGALNRKINNRSRNGKDDNRPA